MKKAGLYISILMILSMLIGCSTSIGLKPGNFRSTTEEKTMVSDLTDRFGDLNQSGTPRFLDVTLTSGIKNGLPIDQTTTFSTSSPGIYVWYSYDNFDNTLIYVEWIHTATSEVIHQERVTSGKNFGRGAFAFKQPKEGWPIGNYQVVLWHQDTASSPRINEVTRNFSIAVEQSASVPGNNNNLPGSSSGSSTPPPQDSNGQTPSVSSNWTAINLPGLDQKFVSLTMGGGIIVARTNEGTIAVSSDGQDWSIVTPGFEVVPSTITWANGLFFGFTRSRDHQYVSSDGRAWEVFTMGTADPLMSIMHTHDGYVGRNERNYILQSDDGKQWQFYSYHKEGYQSRQNVQLGDAYDFAYHNGSYWFFEREVFRHGSQLENLTGTLDPGFVFTYGARPLFGQSTTLLWNNYYVYIWNGNTITQVDPDDTKGGFIQLFEHNGRFLGFKGNGDVYTSSTGDNWVLVQNGPDGFPSVYHAAASGDYVVIIADGVIMFSKL